MQASRFVRELFKNPRTISAIVPPAPAERPGGRLPHGGICCMAQRWNVCTIVFWRVVWFAQARSFVCDHGRARRVSHVVPMTWPCRPGRRSRCGRVVLWLWCPPYFRRRRVVATRRRTLVFAMVLQRLTIPICAINWLRIRWEPTSKQQRRERKDTAADTQTGTATRKPRRIGGMDV